MAFSFGLHMIVKNVSHILPRILDVEGFLDVFDQVVIVDTGSEDGTAKLIQRNYPGIEVHNFEWVNDFSAARNFALSKLNTSTFMWLDADDTFSMETLKQWRKLAQELAKNPVLDGYILPYHYWVDKHDQPIILQYRERILKNPANWEWREPIHEVCCGKEDLKLELSRKDEAPVIHRPDRGEFGENDRNWAILHKHVDSELFNTNAPSRMRTLHYIQKEALSRGQEEYSIKVGQNLIPVASDLNNQNYIMDGYRHLAEAYWRLYKRDKIEFYKLKAIENFEIAIEVNPEFNEARAEYIDLLLESDEVMKAIEVAESLRESYPNTMFCIPTDKYGSFKNAMLARIHLKHMASVADALYYHLLSTDVAKPHPMTYSNHKIIQNYLELTDSVIVYSEEKYVDSALVLKEAILQKGLAKNVIISTCVACCAYARKFYFHVSDNELTCYSEDSHPQLPKYYVSTTDTLPVGFDQTIAMPTDVDQARDLIDNVFDDCVCIVADNLPEAFVALRSFTKKTKAILMFNEMNRKWFEDKIDMHKTKVYTKGTTLYAITGSYEQLMKLGYDSEAVYCADTENLELLDIGKQFRLSVDSGLKNFRIITWIHKRKTVAFAASGIEEWDGNTPFRFGIGASESSLSYLAEELFRLGYDVTVYNTVVTPRACAGVNYVPLALMSQIPKVDLFVSSRLASLMNHRGAKTQVLWCHDMPKQYEMDSYKFVDNYIMVSDWEKGWATKHTSLPKHKFLTIPNGVHQAQVKDIRIKGRSLWVSQPERGLRNVIEMAKKTRVFDDLWVAYGFYNFSASRDSEETYLDTLRTKHELREMGTKIVGRIPANQLRNLMQTVEFVAYPSWFPETQCVALMEATMNGIDLFLSDNGATVPNLTKYLGKKQFAEKAVFPDGKVPYGTKSKEKNWIDAIENRKGTNMVPKINPDFLWSNIVKKWVQLIEE